MGMLLGLGVLWVVTEIIHRGKPHEDRRKLSVAGILAKVDVPTVLFFLGILMAVASLSSAGHLNLLSKWLDEKVGDIATPEMVSVAAMGLEKIDFIWYLKKISWLAIIGYLSGAAVYWLQAQIV
ncbi:MAG: hypothetical protein WC865_05180 [Bacteroidales bacterium]